jgi:hypothetical protein
MKLPPVTRRTVANFEEEEAAEEAAMPEEAWAAVPDCAAEARIHLVVPLAM